MTKYSHVGWSNFKFVTMLHISIFFFFFLIKYREDFNELGWHKAKAYYQGPRDDERNFV